MANLNFNESVDLKAGEDDGSEIQDSDTDASEATDSAFEQAKSAFDQLKLEFVAGDRVTITKVKGCVYYPLWMDAEMAPVQGQSGPKKSGIVPSDSSFWQI